MLARSLIKDNIPPLKISDTGERALKWMQEFRLSYLPLLNGTFFLGMVSENDILGLSDSRQPLGKYALPLEKIFMHDDQHIYDVVKFVSNYNYPLVPLLDSENNYSGLITVMDIMECFADLFGVKVPGGIIQLEVPRHDYVLSKIAQLIEANDAVILSLSSNLSADKTKVEITIKLNRIDLTRILASFYRHDYTVTSFYHQSGFADDLQSRYDSFMHYLKM